MEEKQVVGMQEKSRIFMERVKFDNTIGSCEERPW
jgi:hypothetical protein